MIEGIFQHLGESGGLALFLILAVGWLSWHVSREREKVQLNVASNKQKLDHLDNLMSNMATSAELKEHIKIDEQDHRRLEERQTKLEHQIDRFFGKLDTVVEQVSAANKNVAVMNERIKSGIVDRLASGQ